MKYNGIPGIAISNHGGGRHNRSLAATDGLPEVVETVKGKIPVRVDGGIRQVTGVFKVLAMGTDFIWRPALWGLACKGQAEVDLMLTIVWDEIRSHMGFSRVCKIGEIMKKDLWKVIRFLPFQLSWSILIPASKIE
ncbi:hypothetical protein M433DRAFT_542944 [Acidomyces richmondensis BFW]|nr:hypothetical protein M433DRAFT_542944 [Acidomyces richmondensis BFW]